jgi:DNA-binding beta-propeller fold protein YncE
MDKKRFALVIANSEYQDPDLQKLLAPSSDAEALAKVLRNPEIGEFEVTALVNKRSSEVNEEIEKFFADRGRDDLLLFYFSGHGIKDKDGLLYFATVNTLFKRPRATSIPSEFVNAVMESTSARRKIMFLDCCYSGAFSRGMRAKADKNINTGEYFQHGRGSVVITASDAVQYSFEGDDLEGLGKRSIFTSAIIEGLKTGNADLNNDGQISYEELYDYAYERIRNETPLQRPGKWVFGVQGDIIVARNALAIPQDSSRTSVEKIAEKPVSPTATKYTFVTKWGSKGDGDGQFYLPEGVSLDLYGSLYVCEGNCRIQKFSRDGRFITKWGSRGDGDGQFDLPADVSLDLYGSLYVCDRGNYRIQKFTIDGKFITKWGSKGTRDGQFDWPQGVAVDSSGNVYVTDSRNNRIQKFTNDGKFITKWGSEGSKDGQFNSPYGVSLDFYGNVYVCDTNNNRIQKFTNDGKFITKWGDGQFDSPAGVAVDSSGNVYVSDGRRNDVNIQVFSPS